MDNNRSDQETQIPTLPIDFMMVVRTLSKCRVTQFAQISQWMRGEK
jgi:hypothetical protein